MNALKNNKGFTVIESTVVMTILGVASAFMFNATDAPMGTVDQLFQAVNATGEMQVEMARDVYRAQGWEVSENGIPVYPATVDGVKQIADSAVTLVETVNKGDRENVEAARGLYRVAGWKAAEAELPEIPGVESMRGFADSVVNLTKTVTEDSNADTEQVRGLFQSNTWGTIVASLPDVPGLGEVKQWAVDAYQEAVN